MQWPFKQIWKGEDVFILGGGPSVKHFPVRLLKKSKVIGCNHAYLFGMSVVDVLIFGDKIFYEAHKDRPEFLAFRNPKVTNCGKLENNDTGSIIIAPRTDSGFHRQSLGWNGNTGSAAINLALILGAARIYLIGFDMALSSAGIQNWHKEVHAEATEQHYERYIRAIQETVASIRIKWPGVEIINLNPHSKMDLFLKKSWDQVQKENKEC